MFRMLMALGLAAGAALGFAACSSDSGDGDQAGSCTPGEEIFCRCRGGADATKTCLDDGKSFGECTSVDGPCSEIPEDDDDDDDDGSTTGDSPICFPFDEAPCTCDDGSPGTQTCDASGDFFGDCTTPEGPCGAGSTVATGTTTGGGGGGTSSLFEACVDHGECKTGVCLMGFCTKECGNWQECVDEGDIQGECARFAGGQIQLCAPYCQVQSDCLSAYGEPSACGFGVAPDDPGYGFTVCGDWGEDLTPVPEGITCEEDVDCHLDIQGAERICYFDQCVEGCYEHDQCPGELLCSSSGDTPGTCG